MPKQPVVLPKSGAFRLAKATGFGELLKKHRSRAGFSQEYLAEKARVSTETIGALERGTRRAPYPGTLKLLIGALELSGDERLAFETAAAGARAKRARQERQQNDRTNNLPAQLTPLVGREKDLVQLAALVAKHRLVTVTGSNGVGKTRAAIEVAQRQVQMGREEVWLVDFRALDQDASVPGKIASIVGASPLVGTSARDIGLALTARRMLLLLDHCEHLIENVAATALTLLQTCPDMRVVAASSERLGVAGETLFRLPPLALPDHVPASVEEARTYSALALFIERVDSEAQFVITAKHLPQTAEICRRLDGIPRALELAASRLAILGFANLHSHLNDRLVLAGGGHDLPVRMQRPREAIGWSYDRLTNVEQMLLRRLAVFVAGYTLEDAESVCTDEDLEISGVAEILDSLVHKSLVAVTHSGGVTRYRVIDSVRSYGLEQLAESGELGRLSQQHAHWSAQPDEAGTD